MIPEQSKEPTATKVVQMAGFRSIKEAKKFSKMYALLQILYGQVDSENIAGNIVTIYQNEWAFNELTKMKLPAGFMQPTLEDSLQWFLKNCR